MNKEILRESKNLTENSRDLRIYFKKVRKNGLTSSGNTAIIAIVVSIIEALCACNAERN